MKRQKTSKKTGEMKTKYKRFSLAIGLLLMSLCCSAQYWYSADLETVDKSGYYTIVLDEKIVGSATDLNFSNLRINDLTKREVPYFVRQTRLKTMNREFIAYPLLMNAEKDSLNTVIVENEKRQQWSEFTLKIARADVVKHIRLRGSNDGVKWYIVQQKKRVNTPQNIEDNHELVTVDFPEGSYKYYEIEITNNQKSPLKVMDVGYYQSEEVYHRQTPIDLGNFSVKDSSNRKTYIRFNHLPFPSKIDRLEFTLHHKTAYQRKARITSKPTESQEFVLSSKQGNGIILDAFPITKQTVIEIDNGGNPPLTFQDITAYGLTRSLCAYLEKGVQYSLVMGNDNYLPSNDYDIQFFEKEIPDNLSVITTTNFKSHLIKTPEKRDRIWIEKPLFLWSVLILVGLFLGVICYKIVKELNKRERL